MIATKSNFVLLSFSDVAETHGAGTAVRGNAVDVHSTCGKFIKIFLGVDGAWTIKPGTNDDCQALRLMLATTEADGKCLGVPRRKNHFPAACQDMHPLPLGTFVNVEYVARHSTLVRLVPKPDLKLGDQKTVMTTLHRRSAPTRYTSSPARRRVFASPIRFAIKATDFLMGNSLWSSRQSSSPYPHPYNAWTRLPSKGPSMEPPRDV